MLFDALMALCRLTFHLAIVACFRRKVCHFLRDLTEIVGTTEKHNFLYRSVRAAHLYTCHIAWYVKQ